MMESVMLALLLVALAIGAHYFKWRRVIKAFRLFPGPPALPILGNTIDSLRFKFNQTAVFEHWTKTYGGAVCAWLGTKPFVLLSNPEDAEILLSSTKHIEKAEFYEKLQPWIGLGLLTSKGKRWHMRRKLLTPTFHFKILDQFAEVFNRNSNILVEKLLETKDTVNVESFISLCALDIICETAMGTKVNAQNQSTAPYVQAVHNACATFHARTLKPWLHLDVIFNMSADGKMFKKSLSVLHKYTQDVIASRKRERQVNGRSTVKKADEDLGLKRREAMLDHLLEANDSAGADLKDKDIQEEVDTFMFEGHDTSAAALSFTLYCLAANPEVQDRLVEEMNEIFGDSDRPATSQDIQNMKYAERVVKESLRLYPSVPVFGRVMREDLAITNGYVIPAGVNVFVSALLIGRSPKHWPDPERFDPDRHLPENASGRHPFAFIPFSAGPRNCIGQKFAMMELKSILSIVVRRCKFDVPAPGYKPWVKGQVVLKAPEGVLLNISPRRSASS